jgi:DNA modification methylase
MSWKIINGNSAEILKTYPDNSFDCVVTDPPYGISFLGKAWDHNTGDREVYEQCLRVLKPGGHLLAFSAARTYHHLAMTVETVGFEIRDQIMWIYGSGFPKSQDVGRQIQKSLGVKETVSNPNHRTKDGDSLYESGHQKTEIKGDVVCTDTLAQQWSGWGTQLKPAHEPIVMARKPVIGSIRENVLEYGTGAINIDATRVTYGDNENISTAPRKAGIGIKKFSKGDEYGVETTNDELKADGFITQASELGRFPANVIHDGSDEVVSLFPHSTSGARKSTHKLKGLDTGEQRAVFGDDAISGKYNVQPFTDAQADEGSAARFFYSPKPDGRFPANVIMDDEAGKILDEQAPKVGNLFSGKRTKSSTTGSGHSLVKEKHEGEDNGVFDGLGGASRFFYCPKVSRKERHIGFDPNSQGVIIDSEVFGKTPVCLDCGKTRNGSTKHDGCDPENIGFQERRTERSSDVGNNHPTVKPIELMKYLIKLVTPPNGHILDPFNGSGSTGCAAVELGFDYTGIELDPNYVEIATKRISHWESECKPKTTYNNLFEEK